MKWCRFETEGRIAYGTIEGDVITALDASPIEGGRSTAARLSLSAVKLLPPVEPRNFYAAGANYRAHIEWANRYHGLTIKIPPQADVNYRSPNALIGSGSEIVIPRDSTGPIEYEGELVAIIGRTARHLSPADALDCVAGYTLGNDISERAWQFTDRTIWRAKNADTFKPMGPVVATDLDPMNQRIAVRINGRTVSEYNTRDMLFSITGYLVRMSRYVTLYPGDVLWLGCDGVTIPALQPGDVVEVVNDAIGTLANRVVREA